MTCHFPTFFLRTCPAVYPSTKNYATLTSMNLNFFFPEDCVRLDNLEILGSMVLRMTGVAIRERKRC